MKLRDLGLSYEAALHGVQSAIAFEMSSNANLSSHKHHRVGIDSEKAEMLGLVLLLIEKGVITQEEYVEQMRLSLNEELARREADFESKSGNKVTFR